MEKISKDSIMQRHPEMLFSNLDDEVVMMSLKSNEYFGLNIVASRIWELLKEPCSFGQLTDTLLNEYEIDAQTCERDVKKFLEQLLQKELIILM